MKKRNLIINSAVTAALSMASMYANAAGTIAFAAAPAFAVEGIPSTGAVTVPGGILYTGSDTGATTEGGLVTFTLPSGVTFTSTPSVTGGNNYTAAVVAGGGSGSNTLTVNVTKGVTGTGTNSTGTLTLGAFTVTGATALSGVTAAGAFTFSAQASGFTTAADSDATPLTATLATSGRQNTLAVTAAGADLIDITAPSNGTRFITAGGTKQSFLQLGIVSPGTAGNMNSTNTATYSFPSGTAASLTVTGYPFNAVSQVYLTPVGATTCAATAPTGSITGTATNSSVSFTGLTAGVGARGLCLVNTGTTILPAKMSTAAGATVINAVATRDGFNSAPGVMDLATTLNYNGNIVNVNYVVGNGAGYAMYLNVVNPASAAAPVYVSLRKANGTVLNGTLTSSLGANSSQLFSMADINTATGAALNTESDRAFITLLSTAPIRATNFMLNPGNAVTQIGQTF